MEGPIIAGVDIHLIWINHCLLVPIRLHGIRAACGVLPYKQAYVQSHFLQTL